MAVISDHQIVTVEPPVLQQIINSQEGKLDKNGEQILMEGVCNQPLFYWGSIVSAFFISAASFVIVFPIAICFFCAALKNWKLYLTQNAIHYHQASLSCLGGRSIVIPLSYIKSISIDADCIVVCMETSRAKEFIYTPPTFCGCIKEPEHTNVVIEYVKNSAEFIEAVKRELAAFNLTISVMFV